MTKRKIIKFIMFILILAILIAIIYVTNFMSKNNDADVETNKAPNMASASISQKDDDSIVKVIIDNVFDNILALTIVVIFVTAIINAYMKQRSRDKCLSDFQDFQVTFKMKGGKTIWGKLLLYSRGLELEYKQPYYHKDTKLHKYSFIISKEEFETNIEAIHRYHWDLTPKNQKKREYLLALVHSKEFISDFDCCLCILPIIVGLDHGCIF